MSFWRHPLYFQFFVRFSTILYLENSWSWSEAVFNVILGSFGASLIFWQLCTSQMAGRRAKQTNIWSAWGHSAYFRYLCKYIAILQFELCYIDPWPKPGFSANSRGACALCCKSFVCFVCIIKVFPVAICPARMKTKNVPCNGRVEIVLPCLKYVLISVNMCLKWSSMYNMSALAHFNELVPDCITSSSGMCICSCTHKHMVELVR